MMPCVAATTFIRFGATKTQAMMQFAKSTGKPRSLVFFRPGGVPKTVPPGKPAATTVNTPSSSSSSSSAAAAAAGAAPASKQRKLPLDGPAKTPVSRPPRTQQQQQPSSLSLSSGRGGPPPPIQARGDDNNNDGEVEPARTPATPATPAAFPSTTAAPGLRTGPALTPSSTTKITRPKQVAVAAAAAPPPPPPAKADVDALRANREAELNGLTAIRLRRLGKQYGVERKLSRADLIREIASIDANKQAAEMDAAAAEEHAKAKATAEAELAAAAAANQHADDNDDDDVDDGFGPEADEDEQWAIQQKLAQLREAQEEKMKRLRKITGQSDGGDADTADFDDEYALLRWR